MSKEVITTSVLTNCSIKDILIIFAEQISQINSLPTDFFENIKLSTLKRETVTFDTYFDFYVNSGKVTCMVADAYSNRDAECRYCEYMPFEVSLEGERSQYLSSGNPMRGDSDTFLKRLSKAKIECPVKNEYLNSLPVKYDRMFDDTLDEIIKDCIPSNAYKNVHTHGLSIDVSIYRVSLKTVNMTFKYKESSFSFRFVGTKKIYLSYFDGIEALMDKRTIQKTYELPIVGCVKQLFYEKTKKQLQPSPNDSVMEFYNYYFDGEIGKLNLEIDALNKSKAEMLRKKEDASSQKEKLENEHA